MHESFSLEGELVERKYRVTRTVAEGGFALVYAAEHVALKMSVALKVLKPIVGGSDELLARFALEAQTIARLKHPDIVQVLDTGVLSGPSYPRALPWIVFEWLDGETLKENLAARRGLTGRPPSECLELMLPVFAGIAHAHDQGIAHRDLKPSNIMLSGARAKPRAKVLDFGIAKIMEGEELPLSGDTATEGQVRAFSRLYAAPEQLAGSRTGPWTDVHALALLLTELLTDEPPYPLDDTFELSRLVFDEQRPTPAKFGVTVGAWEPILRRALALRPADRYPDAAALCAALEQEVARADAAWIPRPLSSRAEEVRELAALRTKTFDTYSRTADLDARPKSGARGWLRRLAIPLSLVSMVVLAIAVQAFHGSAKRAASSAGAAPRALTEASSVPSAGSGTAQPQPASTRAPDVSSFAATATSTKGRDGTAAARPPARRLAAAVSSATPAPPPAASSSAATLPYVLE
jgi:serine/threonine protein kinase